MRLASPARRRTSGGRFGSERATAVKSTAFVLMVPVLGLLVGSRQLIFDNRVIVLVRATARQLSAAVEVVDDFAELRAAHTNSSFFSRLSQIEQAEWVNELVVRTKPADQDAPSACILDTGVNRGHPLLEHSLRPRQRTHLRPGYGAPTTMMATGPRWPESRLYGDLASGAGRFPPADPAPPAGVGERSCRRSGPTTPTSTGRSLRKQSPGSRSKLHDDAGRFPWPSLQHPTASPGTPTSWSAAVDALAAGRSFDTLNGELKYIDDARRNLTSTIRHLCRQRAGTRRHLSRSMRHRTGRGPRPSLECPGHRRVYRSCRSR